MTRAYGKPQMGEDAERVSETAALARQHPRARIIYSGGSGLFDGEVIPETEAFRVFLEAHGVEITNVAFEDKARNTHENALYSKALAQPQPGQSWVLVTSAFHMPRAYGTFRKAGWDVIPYPVSYRTSPHLSRNDLRPSYLNVELAIHEWVGIAFYKLTGRM